MSIDQNYI